MMSEQDAARIAAGRTPDEQQWELLEHLLSRNPQAWVNAAILHEPPAWDRLHR